MVQALLSNQNEITMLLAGLYGETLRPFAGRPNSKKCTEILNCTEKTKTGKG